MKHVLWILALLPTLALAQNSRWDYVATTTQGSGQQLPVYALPFATISFFSCTAGDCSAPANTYNSFNSTSACPTGSQVVLQQTASCTNQADAQGNFGAWFLPGQYAYTIAPQYGGLYGPFNFTVGSAGGGSGCISSGTNTLQMSNGSGGCLRTNSDYDLAISHSFSFGHSDNASGFQSFTGGLGFGVTSTTGGIILDDISGGIILSEGTGGISISSTSGGISLRATSGGLELFSDTIGLDATGPALVSAGGSGLDLVSSGTNTGTDDLRLSAQTNRYQFIKGSTFTHPLGHADFDTSLILTGDAFVYTMPRANGILALKGTISSPTAALCANGTGGILTDAGCTTAGVSVPGILYSASGTPLPSCVSGIRGGQAVVSDATSPTYLGTYTSGGAVVAAVLCNGTNWITH